MISISDVIVFAILGALATFSRADIKAKVLDNSDFRQFLEIDPLFREVVSHFYEGKYAECLGLLYQIKQDWIYNYYFADTVAELLRLFRVNMILQFLEPFSCADIKRMAQIFSCSVQEIEKELVALIESDALNAKIDSIDKVSLAMY
jgi:COP9 signalosome complex subunit 1